ncbi:MAG: hypothetical protein L0099_10490 [Acidobacteria bacterium]|nr:hypothetical protein [Acidobacteriota bacterium]
MEMDDIRALDEQFDKGLPVPAVSPADLKQAWLAVRAMEAEFGPRPGHAAGAGALGFDQSSRGPGFATEFFAITTRHWLLSALVDRGVLKDYQNVGQLDERVFRAAATVSFNKEDLAEAMIALKLAGSPAEVVAQVKKDFLAHGYDLDHPRIDRKFLAWMRESG